MKKFLQIAAVVLPMIAMAQSWNFGVDTEGWSKSVGPFTLSAGSGSLNYTITGTTTSSNTLSIINNSATISNPTTYRFLKVVMTNNSPIAEVAFRGDNTLTASTTPTLTSLANNKKLTIDKNTTGEQTYIVDLDGLTTFTGAAGKYEIRLTKAGADSWATTQTISINSIDLLTDITKNDHTFDALDNWVAEANATNNATIAVSGGKLTLSPAGGANAKAKNDYYSVDASNKYIHILYTNNSTKNNRLRVNYASPNDSYATTKSFPDQPIATASVTARATASASGEVVIDASSVADWTGTVRKLAVILTYNDGTAVVPAGVDTGTLEIDRIVVNNINSTLSAQDISKAKSLMVFPNPASDVINFTSKVNKAVIYSVTGQVVKSSNATKTLDVSKLNKGNYLVKVQLEDGSEQVVKFIKK